MVQNAIIENTVFNFFFSGYGLRFHRKRGFDVSLRNIEVIIWEQEDDDTLRKIEYLFIK